MTFVVWRHIKAAAAGKTTAVTAEWSRLNLWRTGAGVCSRKQAQWKLWTLNKGNLNSGSVTSRLPFSDPFHPAGPDTAVWQTISFPHSKHKLESTHLPTFTSLDSLNMQWTIYQLLICQWDKAAVWIYSGSISCWTAYMSWNIINKCSQTRLFKTFVKHSY